jgi:hypothetical protein
MDEEDWENVVGASSIWLGFLVLYVWAKLTLYFYRFYFTSIYLGYRVGKAAVSESIGRVKIVFEQGTYKAIDQDNKVLGVFEEKAIPNSSFQPSQRLKALVVFYNEDSAVVGNGVRIGETLCTATHVVRDATYVGSAYNRKRLLKVRDYELEVCGDLARIKCPLGFFSALGIKAAQSAPARRNLTVRVMTTRLELSKVLPIATHGSIVAAVSATNLPYAYTHTCSTHSGMSGSPIMHNNKVVGIHIGAHMQEDKNVAVEVHPYFMTHLEESVAASDSYLYPPRAKFTNSKWGQQYVEPVLKGKPWADYSDDEDETSDVEYEADFRTDLSEVEVMSSSVSTSSTRSDKLSQLRREAVLKYQNPSSTLETLTLEGDRMDATQEHCQLTRESQTSSQKLPITPTLPPVPIRNESLPLLPIAEAQQPRPAQAEVSVKKRRRKRKKRRKTQNGSTPVSTPSQMESLIRKLSEEQLRVILLKSLQDQPQGASLAPSGRSTN